MALSKSLNDRIALCKGWVWLEKPQPRTYRNTMGDVFMVTLCHWQNSDGELVTIDDRPDFTGTLAGMAGMMRELGHAWVWYFDERILKWCCHRRYYDARVGTGGQFHSEPNHPGDCAGEALLSVFGKEA